MKLLRVVVIAGLATGLAFAQLSTIAPIERRIPPPAAIKVPAARLEALRNELERLERQSRSVAEHAFAADLDVFLKAARFALVNEEFYNDKDPEKVEWAFRQAAERLEQLRARTTPWTRRRGTTVRGFRSAVDGSLQPYALTIPERLDLGKPAPLYIWLHGRGDTTTDLHFIHQRSTRGPQFPLKDPVDAMILEPFGRQSLGWKSTGEIDVFEALAEVKKQYAIDEDRIVLTGYSM